MHNKACHEKNFKSENYEKCLEPTQPDKLSKKI